MTEALSGYTHSESPHSPQFVEQAPYIQNIPEIFPKVITSTSELALDLMFSKPWEVISDVGSVSKDFAKAFREHWQVHFDPVYFGHGVPRGNGEKVIQVGGLWSNVLHYWDRMVFLRRIGYRSVPYPWGPVNRQGPRETGKKLLKFLADEAKESGQRVIGDGHSLGVYQLLAAFCEDPDQFVGSVKELVLNGGPWPTKINRAVETVFLLSRSPFQTEDDFEIGKKAPLLLQAMAAGDIKITSIVSSNDRVIQGIPLGRTIVLDGASHSFLAGHRDSMKATAYTLAGRGEELEDHANISLAKAA